MSITDKIKALLERIATNWSENPREDAAEALKLLTDQGAELQLPADVAWMTATFGINSMAICDWKRLAYHVGYAESHIEIGWCPQSGSLPQCVCADRIVLLSEPTRGQLLQLLAALNITPGETK